MGIPDQTGKIAIVTGSNTGIGEVTARELARAGARVYMACRSTRKATEAMARIRTDVPDADLRLLELDLGSLDAVRGAAAEFLAKEDELHLLVNNAGLASIQGQTVDGFELAFGVNHLGHFLLTMLLLDTIRESAPARIVNVASDAHYRVKGGIDWAALREPTRTVTGLDEYGVSKLANILFTSELDRRLDGADTATFALHPGVVASEIWRRIPRPFSSIAKMFMLSTEEGAETQIYLATDPDVVDQSGLFWEDKEPKKPSRLARDEELARELWERSLEWAGVDDPL